MPVYFCNKLFIFWHGSPPELCFNMPICTELSHFPIQCKIMIVFKKFDHNHRRSTGEK